MSVEISLRHEFPGFALDVAFALPKPGVTALFGASGAGKTTIVNAIAGTFRPREGRIVINGRTVLDTDAGIFVVPAQRRAGYVFQDARLFPHMSVENNLLFGWRRAANKVSAGDIEHVVALLGLRPLLQRRPRALSGGEKGRVALGRALLSSPEILLLDEPLASLDAAPRRNPALSRKPARRGAPADALCQPRAGRGGAPGGRHRGSARRPVVGGRARCSTC